MPFRAGGDAAEAAYAVRVTHKLRVCHVDVHGAVAGAVAALAALLRVAADAEDSQHAEEPLAGAAGAEVVAERPVDEETEQQEEDDDATRRGQQVPVPHHGKVLRPLQQPDGEPQGQCQVEAVAQHLQVALDALRHAHARQVEQAPQLRHPILRSAQLAHPAAEEDSQQQNGGQHPLAHIFGIWCETENQTCHEYSLHQKSKNLDFAPFLAHVPIL